MKAQTKLQQRLQSYQTNLSHYSDLKPQGSLVRMVGLTLEAVGCYVPVGTRCMVSANDGIKINAEVVGFANDKLFLMTTESTHGLAPGAKVTPLFKAAEVGVSNELLGRVIDGTGKPLDGKGKYAIDEFYSLHGEPINPLNRSVIRHPLDVGVRCLNALTTIGSGQRIGLFAGPGVGKSVLLGMMTRFTTADVIVVGLVGERGREVKEFLDDCLGEEGMQRSVVVAAPSDTSPLVRLHAAMRATSIAEYFRDKGAKVLLLLDSLSRFAHAQRELGLAIGEPPATKGYPPSVFARLSKLIERAGNAKEGGGSITAFYTVLVEGDEKHDPVAEAVRSYLDGRIALTRDLADQGVFPALDVETSISRVMNNITDKSHQKFAREFKRLFTIYQHARDLIQVGAYEAGSDAEVDRAIALMPKMLQFMSQPLDICQNINDSIEQLKQLLAEKMSDDPAI